MEIMRDDVIVSKLGIMNVCIKSVKLSRSPLSEQDIEFGPQRNKYRQLKKRNIVIRESENMHKYDPPNLGCNIL